MTVCLRALVVVSLVFAAALVPDRLHAQTAVSVSAHVGDFHLAVSNYYRVPEREVIVIRERRIPDHELPVVLFIAQRASVAPATIVDLRLRGISWWDISLRYRLGPEIYYVPVAVTPGPPYGKAYGYYKKPRKQWNTIVLSDADVVNLVHLRFLSEYHGVPPERVIELRGQQTNFVAIHGEVARGRGAGANGNGRGANNGGRGRGGR